MASRTDLPSWQALTAHAQQLKQRHIKELFKEDDSRFEKFSIELPHLLFDYSKNLITDETKAALLALAEATEVESWRTKMFAGEHINRTEDRAVMHVALRDKSGQPICARDDEADEEYRRLFGELLATMKESPAKVERALHYLLAARNLERVGDHATNIAEDVIYYLEATDVRHSQPPSAIRSLGAATPGRPSGR
jgi:Na+/phosphate symporter